MAGVVEYPTQSLAKLGTVDPDTVQVSHTVEGNEVVIVVSAEVAP